MADFPPLPPAPHPSVGEPSSAPAAVSFDINNIVDEACDSLLDDLSSSSVSSGDSDASSVSSVEDTPTKGGAPDVNSNADSSFCDLNDNSRNNKAIDKSNDIVNVNSLVNADARSSSKASVIVSGASVCSNLSTVDAAGGFGSSILVDGSNDKDSTAATNVELDASLNAGLFGPDSEIDCSLNDAQILSPSSECPESQSILLGISKVVDGSGPSCAAGPSQLVMVCL